MPSGPASHAFSLSRPRMCAIICALLLASHAAFAFTEMSRAERARLSREAREMRLDALEAALRDKSQQREQLEVIIDELSRRGSTEALACLERFIAEMETNRTDSFEADQLRTRALIGAARVRSAGDAAIYLKALKTFLEEGNSELARTAVYEISQMGSPQARRLLEIHKDDSQIGPIIRIEWLRSEVWPLPNQEFAQALLSSARVRLQEGDTHFVAERTLLAERAARLGMTEAALPERAPHTSGLSAKQSEAYRAFIAETRQRVKELVDTYHPGLRMLPENPTVSDIPMLEECCANQSKSWLVRQRACELLFSSQFEELGLESAREKASHLLTHFEGIQEQDAAYWEGNTISESAVSDLAVVSLLVSLEEDALPAIQHEIETAWNSCQLKQIKALQHVIGEIERRTEARGLLKTRSVLQ